MMWLLPDLTNTHFTKFGDERIVVMTIPLDLDLYYNLSTPTDITM